jgi:hypothetical protein
MLENNTLTQSVLTNKLINTIQDIDIIWSIDVLQTFPHFWQKSISLLTGLGTYLLTRDIQTTALYTAYAYTGFFAINTLFNANTQEVIGNPNYYVVNEKSGDQSLIYFDGKTNQILDTVQYQEINSLEDKTESIVVVTPEGYEMELIKTYYLDAKTQQFIQEHNPIFIEREIFDYEMESYYKIKAGLESTPSISDIKKYAFLSAFSISSFFYMFNLHEGIINTFSIVSCGYLLLDIVLWLTCGNGDHSIAHVRTWNNSHYKVTCDSFDEQLYIQHLFSADELLAAYNT